MNEGNRPWESHRLARCWAQSPCQQEQPEEDRTLCSPLGAGFRRCEPEV